MSVKQYILKVDIEGENKGLKKAISESEGELRRLSDTEVAVSLDLDAKNQKAVRAAIQEMIDMNPTLNVQLTYDLNEKRLRDAQDELAKAVNLDNIFQQLKSKSPGTDKPVEEYILSEMGSINKALDDGMNIKDVKDRFKGLLKFMASVRHEMGDTFEFDDHISNMLEKLGTRNKTFEESYYKYTDNKTSTSFESDIQKEILQHKNLVTVLKEEQRYLEQKGAIQLNVGEAASSSEKTVHSLTQLLSIIKGLKAIEEPPILSDSASIDEKANRLKELAAQFDAITQEIDRLKSSNESSEDITDRIALLEKMKLKTVEAYNSQDDAIGDPDSLDKIIPGRDSWNITNFTDKALKALRSSVAEYQDRIGHEFDKATLTEHFGSKKIIKSGTLMELVGNILNADVDSILNTELADAVARINARKMAMNPTEEYDQQDAAAAKEKANAEKEAADNAERGAQANKESAESAEREATSKRESSSSEDSATNAEEAASKFSHVKEILESIDATLKQVSASFGQIDEASGLNSLISSLKTINDLLSEISSKDFNLIFNEADTSSNVETALDKEINNQYQRYSKAYDRIISSGKKYGMNSDAVLASIYGSDEKRTGYSDLSSFLERFSKGSLKKLDAKEYITQIQELISYVKSARKEMSGGLYDEFKNLSLPTEDTKQIKKKFEDVVKQTNQDKVNDTIEGLKSNVKEVSNIDLSKIESTLENIVKLFNNLDGNNLAEGFKQAGSVLDDIISKFKTLQSGDLGESAESTSSKASKEAGAFSDVRENAERATEAKSELTNANKKLGNEAESTASSMGKEASAIDDVNKSSSKTTKTQDEKDLEKFYRDYDKQRARLGKYIVDDKFTPEGDFYRKYLANFDQNQSGYKLADMFDAPGEENTFFIQSMTESIDDYISEVKLAEAEYKKFKKLHQELTSGELFHHISDLDKSTISIQNSLVDKVPSLSALKEANSVLSTISDRAKEAKKATEDFQDALNKEESMKRQQAEAQKQEAATDITKEIKALYSQRGQYVNNIKALGSTDKSEIDIIDSIKGEITQYENRVSGAKAAVESLTQAWGEDDAVVKKVTGEFDKLMTSNKTSLSNDIIKRATSLSDKIIGAEMSKISQGSSFMPEFSNTLQNAKSELSDIIKNVRDLRSKDLFDEGSAKSFELQLSKIDSTIKGISAKENIQATEGQLNNILQRINGDLSKGGMTRALKKEYEDLQNEVNNYIKALQNASDEQQKLGVASRIDVDKLSSTWRSLNAQFKESSITSKFAEAINNQSAQFLATYFSFQDMIRYSKEIAQTVVGTDSALIELKKVSDASNERIQQSFTKSAETAQELGSTITSVINSTADWARLGYDVDQAEELARVTTLYQTVGDNMTQESASKSLVSMLQGFQLDASQAERVLDSVNEVANNFAIDTAGGDT